MTRWVELRRHSLTKKGDAKGRGSGLSREGVELARTEGSKLDRVRYVAVSESPRTLETAIAMGFAVDDVVAIAGSNVTGEVGFHEWWDWPNPWAVYAERIATRPALAAYADNQAQIVRNAVGNIAEGETALLIGHGGWIEPTVIALLGVERVENWGPPFDHLEGVRLSEESEIFSLTEVKRRSSTLE